LLASDVRTKRTAANQAQATTRRPRPSIVRRPAASTRGMMI
jgi:hypothetical protein